MKNGIFLTREKIHIWIENFFHQFSPGNLVATKWGQTQWPTFPEQEKENKNMHTQNYPITWTIQWKLTLLLGNSNFHIYFTSADIYIQTIIFMLFSSTFPCHFSNKPLSSMLIRNSYTHFCALHWINIWLHCFWLRISFFDILYFLHFIFYIIFFLWHFCIDFCSAFYNSLS